MVRSCHLPRRVESPLHSVNHEVLLVHDRGRKLRHVDV